MEEMIEKIGWKKFAIIVVVLCFVLLSFALLSFMNIDRKQTEVLKKKIETNKQQTNNSNKSEGFKNTEFQPYITSDYQLKYPGDMTVQKAQPAIGAKSSVQFVNQNNNSSIFIEVFAKPKNSYEDLIRPYLLNNYEPEAQPLSFENSVEFIPKKIEDPLIHKKIDFVEKKDVIIKITLTYSKNGLDTELERNFVKMMLSLK